MKAISRFFAFIFASAFAFRVPYMRSWKLGGTRKYQVAFAQQMTTLTNAKEVLLSSENSTLTKQELNEYILQLEKLNPTEDPALSPLLNGVWEVISSGYFTPGMLGVQALRASPFTMLTCKGPVITISNSSPRVSVCTTVKMGNAAVPFTVETELEVESGVRVREMYVKGKVGRFEVPLASVHQFSREVLVSYLDADLLIARNALGEPEVLRRLKVPEFDKFNLVSLTVKMDNRSKTRPKQESIDDWDDSVILSSFETGIQSFRTKSQTAKVENRPSSVTTSSFANCLSSYVANNTTGKPAPISPAEPTSVKVMKSGVLTTEEDSSKGDAVTRKRKLDGGDGGVISAAGAGHSVFGADVVADTENVCIAQPQPEQQQQQSAEHSHSEISGYPALPPSTGSAAEDEALQGLLMAWYYSGYATGRYQALKELGYYNTSSDATMANAAADSDSSESKPVS